MDLDSAYLTFTLDGMVFAIPISSVREVIEYASVTRVPRAPAFMQGVTNLRGNVVPVMDSRIRLGLEPGETTVDSCIVIVDARRDELHALVGITADSVLEVTALAEIAPAPLIGSGVKESYVSGMARIEDDFATILDMSALLPLNVIAGLNPDASTSTAHEVETPA